MASDDRAPDEPPLAGAASGSAQPSAGTPTAARPTDLRVRLLHDCFATPEAQLETTLPPDDPEADLAWTPLRFVWRTTSGDQPVIMPLWRRLD